MTAVRMWIAGASAITSLLLLFVLTFMQSLIISPVSSIIMSGTYTRAFGINNIPIILNMVWWIILVAAIVSVIWVVIEAFAEISYYPEA